MGIRRLRATGGPLTGLSFILEERTILGRAGDAEVQLLTRGVSRHHAVITLADGQPIIRDLSSKNGTHINGQRVSQHSLAGGDSVRIDTHDFVYEELTGQAANDDSDMLYVMSGPAEDVTGVVDVSEDLAALEEIVGPLK